MAGAFRKMVRNAQTVNAKMEKWKLYVIWTVNGYIAMLVTLRSNHFQLIAKCARLGGYFLPCDFDCPEHGFTLWSDVCYCTTCRTAYTHVGKRLYSSHSTSGWCYASGIKEDCTTCGGDGLIDKRIPCASHGYTYTHVYCSHNKVGQHDS